MIRPFLLVLAVLTLQACVSVRSSHGYVLEADQTELTAKIGFDTKDSMLAKYGEPSMIGVFDRNAWYYLHSTDQTRAFFKPKTKTRKVIAVHFDEEGSVNHFDTYTLEDGEDIRLVQRETPTRGRELNFWEQLLGNVGALPASLGEEGPVPGQ
ncbi:outer membrane protein assembly factor BamE [Hyphococcus sp.]|uniref:outer membrane protein assembly factor BamE n=1 Tax=Hyphococcus sp. TaxID=2038636 RepID=UPI00207F39B6|nr:MAG: SmpA/OmlA family lipoprotein [Marinicaulis sp.]